MDFWKYVECVFRLPFLFLLEGLLTLDVDYYYSWTPNIRYIQLVGLFLCAVGFVLSRDNLISFYNYSLFIVDVLCVNYLNIYNSLDLYWTVVEGRNTDLSIQDVCILFPVIMGSWLFYMASLVAYSNAFNSWKPIIFSTFFSPVVFSYIMEDEDKGIILSSCFGISVYLALDSIYMCTVSVINSLYSSFRMQRVMLRTYGWTVTMIFHWRRVHVPLCFILFWMLHFFYKYFCFLFLVDQSVSIHVGVLSALTNSCNSFVSMLSLCFATYMLCGCILKYVQIFHRMDHPHIADERALRWGFREGCGLFFLALYTGITRCEPSRKLLLMEVIMYLITSALIRSIFEVTEPVLMGLTATPTASLRKHLKVIAFCIMLIFLSVLLGLYIFEVKERLPFLTPNVITVTQIIGALLLYFLYMYDSYHAEVWEELDDYVFYINGGCKVSEFIVITIVLFYRVSDTTLEWTIFQILISVAHIYVNMWLPARQGWRSLMQRHRVNQRLNILPQATPAEITNLQDVCAICLEELKSARVTPCKHFFHSFCLKKWLQIKNECPLCHTLILYGESEGTARTNENQN